MLRVRVPPRCGSEDTRRFTGVSNPSESCSNIDGHGDAWYPESWIHPITKMDKDGHREPADVEASYPRSAGRGRPMTRPLVTTPPMTASAMHLGDLSVIALYDGSRVGDPAQTYATVSASGGAGGSRGMSPVDWRDLGHLLTPDGMLEMTFGGFLVRSASSHRLVIIDTGVGPNAPGLNGGHLLDSLSRAGYKPSDVTDVVFTHLPRDHTGFAAEHGRPTFPNAVYRCDVRDLDHFYGTDKTITDNLTAVADRFETWDSDRTVAPGIDVRPMPGHTPGSSVVVLSSGSHRAMLLGDVVHCLAELLYDEWAGLADVDPVQALRVRNALAKELESGETLVASGHFPGLQFGRLWRAAAARALSCESRSVVI